MVTIIKRGMWRQFMGRYCKLFVGIATVFSAVEFTAFTPQAFVMGVYLKMELRLKGKSYVLALVMQAV